MKEATLFVFILIGLAITTSAEERSFRNGFATRQFGNVYVVESYEDDGSGERADKAADNSDGPEKGNVIGLTSSEKAKHVRKIVCPECQD